MVPQPAATYGAGFILARGLRLGDPPTNPHPLLGASALLFRDRVNVGDDSGDFVRAAVRAFGVALLHLLNREDERELLLAFPARILVHGHGPHLRIGGFPGWVRLIPPGMCRERPLALRRAARMAGVMEQQKTSRANCWT